MHNIAGNLKRTNSQFTQRWSLIHFCGVTNSKLIRPVLDKEASPNHLAREQSSPWWRSWRRSEMSWTRSSRRSPRTAPTPRSASPFRGPWTDVSRCQNHFPQENPQIEVVHSHHWSWPFVGLTLVSSSSFLVVTTCALVTLDVVTQSEYKAFSATSYGCCSGSTFFMCVSSHYLLCDLIKQ